MLEEYEFEEVELPPEIANWSPIAEGVKTFEAITKELENRPENSRVGQYSAADVLWDLRACLLILKKPLGQDECFRVDVC